MARRRWYNRNVKMHGYGQLEWDDCYPVKNKARRKARRIDKKAERTRAKRAILAELSE